jgi:hypothetical protein
MGDSLNRTRYQELYIQLCHSIDRDAHQPGTTTFVRIGAQISSVTRPPCSLIFRKAKSGLGEVDWKDDINNCVENR